MAQISASGTLIATQRCAGRRNSTMAGSVHLPPLAVLALVLISLFNGGELYFSLQLLYANLYKSYNYSESVRISVASYVVC